MSEVNSTTGISRDSSLGNKQEEIDLFPGFRSPLLLFLISEAYERGYASDIISGQKEAVNKYLSIISFCANIFPWNEFKMEL